MKTCIVEQFVQDILHYCLIAFSGLHCAVTVNLQSILISKSQFSSDPHYDIDLYFFQFDFTFQI